MERGPAEPAVSALPHDPDLQQIKNIIRTSFVDGAVRPDGAPGGGARTSSLVQKDAEVMKELALSGQARGIVFYDPDRQITVSDIRWKADRYELAEGSQFVCFNVCRAGGGRYRQVGDKQKLAGQLLPGMVTVNLPGARNVLDSPDMRLASVGVTPSRLAGLWRDMVPKTPLSSIDASRFYRDPLIEQMIIATVDQADSESLSSLFFDHALSLLVHQIAGLQDKADQKSSGLSRRQVSAATDFMQSRLADDIRLQELANLVDLSIGEFKRKFRASFGIPPYAYLIQLRMKEAAQLLSSSTMTVSEISSRVGYINPSQFARSFQRFSGLSPMKWRTEKRAR